MTVQARRIAVIAFMLMATCGVLFVVFRSRLASDQRPQDQRVRDVLRIGIDPGVRPFSFFGAAGWEGYEADVAREVGRRLSLLIEAVPVGYDGFEDALQTDRVDIAMSALVPDASHLNDIVYSDATIDVGVRLIGGIGQAYREPSDLRNMRVGVELGSEADRTARWYERRVPGLQRIVVDGTGAVARGLHDGSFEWAMVDGVSSFALGSRGFGLGTPPQKGARRGFALGCPAISHRDGSTHLPTLRCYSIQPVPYVIAATRPNAPLITDINRVLDAMQADGTLDQLAVKWLGPNAR